MEADDDEEGVDPGEEFRNRVLSLFYGDTSRWPDAMDESEDEEDEDEEDDLNAAAARFMDDLEKQRAREANSIPRQPPEKPETSLMPQRKKKKKTEGEIY